MIMYSSVFVISECQLQLICVHLPVSVMNVRLMASCEDTRKIYVMWHLSWDHEYIWGIAILDTNIEKWSLKWRGLFKEFKVGKTCQE